MAKTRNLTLCGVSLPFDGAPRFAEIEAYDAALRDGGAVFTLIRHLAPVIINTRLRPSNPFVTEAHTPIDEDTALAVLTVVEAIQGAISGPKVTAALAKMNAQTTPSR